MWMMTQHAFSSTVYKQVEPGWFMMRFRDQESADWVCKLGDIDSSRVYADMPSDYPLRLKISEDELVKYFLAEVKQLDYPNFKNRALTVRGKVYHDALSRVWSAMWSLTPPKLRAALRKADDDYDRAHGLGKYRPKAKGGSYRSGSAHVSTDASVYADADWWYRNFPPQRDPMDADSDFSDMELDDETLAIDRLLDELESKSVHDLTEDEWRRLMEENPGGI